MAPKDIEERLKELEKFKTRIELGSFYLRCAWYVVGGIALFIATVFSIVKDWPFK
jgi:hypothetical protein